MWHVVQRLPTFQHRMTPVHKARRPPAVTADPSQWQPMAKGICWHNHSRTLQHHQMLSFAPWHSIASMGNTYADCQDNKPSSALTQRKGHSSQGMPIQHTLQTPHQWGGCDKTTTTTQVHDHIRLYWRLKPGSIPCAAGASPGVADAVVAGFLASGRRRVGALVSLGSGGTSSSSSSLKRFRPRDARTGFLRRGSTW